MKKTSKYRIAIVGTGNVATHLVLAFKNTFVHVSQIFSRDIEKAKKLCEITQAQAIDNFSNLSNDLDLIILAVKDDIINPEFLNAFPKNSFIVHTSGSVDMSVLSDFTSFGVFYPLQTFSKSKNIDFAKVPICIEANKETNLEMLKEIALNISSDVRKINSEQRTQIHLAAVFACNFTNYLFHISETILQEKNLDFEILFPLLQETIEKVRNASPKEMQTGPAIRNDNRVLNKHIEMLEKHPEFQEIYKILTKNIKEIK